MDVTATSSATSSYGSTGSASAPGAISSDFNTFLRMLTVQMQNQDPLNPIESSDYAVQLATFSGVEQQVRTNQLLDAMATQFSLMGMSQLAGWVGQEARAAAPVWFSGAPVTLSPNPVASADRAVLVVRDAAGNTVSREDVPMSSEPYHWLGGDATGDPLPDGRYIAVAGKLAGRRGDAGRPRGILWPRDRGARWRRWRSPGAAKAE